MKRFLILFLAVVAGCHSRQSSASSPFDEADQLWLTREMPRARKLYIEASKSDPDPIRRDRATIRAANLDWHVFQDAPAARVKLAAIRDESPEAARAWLSRSLLETELAHDYPSAREAARRAAALARTSGDRAAAMTRGAAATLARATSDRLAGKCVADGDELQRAISELHNAIETGGPLLEPSRLLLNAALLIGDGEQALIAWRWYYAEKPSGIADVDARLASALASWKSGTAPSIESRRDVALALARSRLFPEADLALRDPCRGAAIDDAATHDLILYAAALRRINAITAESYRSVAAHTKGPNLKREVLAEGEALWKALSWPNGVPKFSSEALLKELGTRFGAVATLGETDDIPTLLLGHSVIDETREVEQYGRKASLHFMQLDGMVSSGYSAWLTYGDVGTGGWSGSGGDIVQIRTMYADDAVESWRRMTDPVERSERDRRVASESKRDEERIRANAIAPLPGLQMRLGRQGLEKIRDELSASGLAGDALRDAFIARARRDKFESSIWAHEGRHAIDKTQFGIKDSTELEFRAKLSEIVFARSPRLMGSILDPIGGSSAHGRANERIMKGVVESMRAHASEIAGFDKSAPVLPQLDRLTDDQIRAAFRSLDPLAK